MILLEHFMKEGRPKSPEQRGRECWGRALGRRGLRRMLDCAVAPAPTRGVFNLAAALLATRGRTSRPHMALASESVC